MADAHDTTIAPTSKPCKGCGETKPLAAYAVQPAGKYGRTARCKECWAHIHLAKRGPYSDRQRVQLRSAQRLGLTLEPTPEDTPDGPIIKVPLKGGAFAVVDAADWPLVSRHQWCLMENGYVVTSLTVPRRMSLLMHRLIMGDEPGVEYDHEDRDKLNNRRKNLRIATRSLNNANMTLRSNNTSGFKGVCWRPALQKWRAEISVNRKNRYLGLFNTPEDAARAYNDAALEAFGEFAVLNHLE